MRLPHIFIGILVAAIWGLSFVVMKMGLGNMPPLLLCFMRFFLTCFPAIFFVKKPNMPWYKIMSYGLIMFAIKFSLLFAGIYVGLTAGLASLLIQLQVYFTLFLAVIVLKEAISFRQVLSAIVAGLGLVDIISHVGHGAPAFGLLFIVLSAFSWGIGNIISTSINKANIMGLVVWGSLFAWPLLLLVSLYVDGVHRIMITLYHISWVEIAAILFMAYPVTLFGFYMWSWLLNKYDVSTIVSFGLLIPVFGMLGSIIVFGEPLQSWKLMASLFIIGGLYINMSQIKKSSFLKYETGQTK